MVTNHKIVDILKLCLFQYERKYSHFSHSALEAWYILDWADELA